MKKILRSTFAILFVVLFVACAKEKEKVPPEDKLLNYFKLELSLLEKNQDNYVEYMLKQLVYYKKKNRLFVEAITEINDYFENLADEEKEVYQRQQRERFQPVIDAIYDKTREMIVKQTATLTPEKMAKIQEYSVKLEELEKDIPAVKLVPVFFITPELPQKKDAATGTSSATDKPGDAKPKE